jgi:hypothetical protein
MAYDAPIFERTSDAARDPQTRDAIELARPRESVALGLGLATVLDIQADVVTLRMRGRTLSARLDACVDPALVAQAKERGARVVVDVAEDGESHVVAGVLMTARTLEIDRQGNLEAQLKSLVLRTEEALIQTPNAFLRLRDRASELFAGELVLRGRLLTRILGKTIKLN